MSRTPHTCCARGKRVRVTLTNGDTFVDRFVGRTSRAVMFEKRKVVRSEIKAFTIWKDKERTA